MRILTSIVLLFALPAMTAVAAPGIEVPPIAGYIADQSSLRTIVRVLLAPIVFTIENPGLAALLFFAFVGAIWGWRRFLFHATPE